MSSWRERLKVHEGRVAQCRGVSGGFQAEELLLTVLQIFMKCFVGGLALSELAFSEKKL